MRTLSLIPQFEDIKLHAVDNVAATLLNKFALELEEFKNLANPLFCDEKYLTFLAYAFKVDFWDEDLSVEEKRRLCQASLLLHRKKGTMWAMEQVFEALGITASIAEWFNYKGKPYHFKVDLDIQDKGIDEFFYSNLEQKINSFKNVRSVLEKINVNLKTQIKEVYKIAIFCGESIEVLPYQVEVLENNFYEKYAIATKLSETISINLILGDLI